MNRILATSIAITSVSALAGSARTIASEPRTFMFVEGRDTASETFTRDANSVTGDMAFGKDHIHYEGKIAADGTMPRLDIRVSGAQTRQISVIVEHDSTRLTEQVGGKSESARVASPSGAFPFINLSVGLSEVLIARARSQKTRSATLPTVIAFDLDNLDKSSQVPLRARAVAEPLVLTFVPGDSVRLGIANAKDRVRMALGADGNIRGVVSGADAKDRFKAVPKK